MKRLAKLGLVVRSGDPGAVAGVAVDLFLSGGPYYDGGKVNPARSIACFARLVLRVRCHAASPLIGPETLNAVSCCAERKGGRGGFRTPGRQLDEGPGAAPAAHARSAPARSDVFVGRAPGGWPVTPSALCRGHLPDVPAVTTAADLFDLTEGNSHFAENSGAPWLR